MNNLVFARESALLSHSQFTRAVNASLLQSLQLYPYIYFDGSFQIPNELQKKHATTTDVTLSDRRRQASTYEAHFKGVNALEIDKFEGKILLSGGADGSLKLWNLEDQPDPTQDFTHRPTLAIPRVRPDNFTNGHTSGITHVAFSPSTPSTFFSSSYDATIKSWSPERAKSTASWDLRVPVNTFEASPLPGAGGFIACATEGPHVQVVDPRSGSASRAFIGAGGAVLSLAWSPVSERTLCSGHADGTIKVWDSRRFAAPVAKFDGGDFLGVTHRFRYALAGESGWGRTRHLRQAAVAHKEGVCGLGFSDDGWWLVSMGLDRKMGVWNAEMGANTMVDMGVPLVKREGGTCKVLVTPGKVMGAEGQMVVVPNGHEVLGVGLRGGDVKMQLRVPGGVHGRGQMAKVQTIAWRGGNGQGRLLGGDVGGRGIGSHGGIYAGYSDGKIRVFGARLPGGDEGEDEEEEEEAEEGRERKRRRMAVEEAYRSLMGTQVRYM